MTVSSVTFLSITGSGSSCKERWEKNVLVLGYSGSISLQTEVHDRPDSQDVCDGSEASGWQVSLVLYGAVAAYWGHVLRHCEVV